MLILGIAAALLILNLLVVAHELGHYFVARRIGVRAYEFGIGLPPRLFGIWTGSVVVQVDTALAHKLPTTGSELSVTVRRLKDGRLSALSAQPGRLPPKESRGGDDIIVGKLRSNDGTQIVVADMLWAVNLIPLGGYVAMLGERTLKLPTSLAIRKPAAKILILAAGILINLLLPFILLPASNLLPHQIQQGDVIVQEVLPNTPAAHSEVQVGDRLVELNGQPIATYLDLAEAIDDATGHIVPLTLERQAQSMTVIVDLTASQVLGVQIGFKNPTLVTINSGFRQAIATGWNEALSFYPALYDLLKTVINEPTTTVVVGPVGVGQITGQIISQSSGVLNISRSLIRLAALLSFSIGIFNLVPLPPLDGGKMFLVAVESAFRRTLSPRIERLIGMFGLLVLLSLTFMLLANDLLNVGMN